MRRQKKFLWAGFLALGLLFSWPFFSEQKILAADQCTDPLLCVDNCPSNKPYEKASPTCNDVGLRCCSAVKDTVEINNPTINSCAGTTEGVSGGFLSFKGSVVPCGRNCDDPNTAVQEDETCTLCHFILMAKNIYDLLFAMVIFACILAITIGGTIYLVSFGNSKMTGIGKGLITKTLIGFALFLLGELIVFTVLSFVGAKFGLIGSGTNWYEFTCDTKSVFGSDTSFAGGKSASGGGWTGAIENCSVGTGDCAEASLKNACMVNNTDKISKICQAESGGNASSQSGTDKCADGTTSYSFGLFQISLIAHASKLGYNVNDIFEITQGTNHNSTTYGDCLTWNDAKGYCAVRNCKVKNLALYEEARDKLFNKETNLKIACQLSGNGSNLSPWSYTKNKCGL